jgi:hypothetical protein
MSVSIRILVVATIEIARYTWAAQDLMGSSFTEFQQNGFWSRDGALELWLVILAQEVEASGAPPSWLADTAKEWRAMGTAGMNGCIDAGLDRHAATPERAAAVVRVAERALTRLKDQGPVLTASWLNSVGSGSEGSTFSRDIPTEVFIRIGETFV